MIGLFLWAVLCFAADRVMTEIAIKRYGARELNPVLLFLTLKIGVVPATISAGVLYLGVVIYLTEVRLVAPLVVLLAGYTAVCAHNAIELYQAANRRKR